MTVEIQAVHFDELEKLKVAFRHSGREHHI